MKTISQRDLRNDSGKILDAVEAGEIYTISRNGKPVGELRPVGRRAFVPIAELLRTAAHLPPVDYTTFRADLDAMIDQDPHDE
ncbi:type II toxin-antitoxin system Phd/YefM family antitoxin [Nocardia sp. NPDC004068]|uniref:type II toxin-antitoxin system Phd/YefM family antitoxin n=1 Tax=Nocardia sp. NPDC004068 TaxID=3364303 RepID=UPI0036CCE549